MRCDNNRLEKFTNKAQNDGKWTRKSFLTKLVGCETNAIACC